MKLKFRRLIDNKEITLSLRKRDVEKALKLFCVGNFDTTQVPCDLCTDLLNKPFLGPRCHDCALTPAFKGVEDKCSRVANPCMAVIPGLGKAHSAFWNIYDRDANRPKYVRRLSNFRRWIRAAIKRGSRA